MESVAAMSTKAAELESTILELLHDHETFSVPMLAKLVYSSPNGEAITQAQYRAVHGAVTRLAEREAVLDLGRRGGKWAYARSDLRLMFSIAT
jgi:hypothetical protein